MSFESISTAVVGAGFIGPVHVEALRRLGVHITGILGVDEAESESARAQLGLPRAYRSFDEVLADGTVDAVHLAVPNVLHFALAKRALEGGKHVLCEKPLAMNTDETSELVALARGKALAAGVCYNIRYYPLNLEAARMVRDGELGDILAVNGSYAQDWLLYDTDYNWRVLADQGGALRAIADIGTHWMDLIHAVTNVSVDAVFADLNTVHKTRYRPTGEVETFTGKQGSAAETEPVAIDTDDYGAVLFRYGNGARGSLVAAQVVAGRKNCLRYEIAGSKQSIAWNSESPNDLWVGRRGEPNQVLMRDPALLAPGTAHYVNYPGGHNEGFPDAFKQCFRSFYDVIAAGDFDADPGYPTFADGHREVALCEAILQSHREERWVQPKED